MYGSHSKQESSPQEQSGKWTPREWEEEPKGEESFPPFWATFPLSHECDIYSMGYTCS